MSLSNALRIATSGMQYNQVGLGTVSHNVVNANTPGFTRQQVQGAAVAYNGLGAGVDLQTIQRITDSFLESRSLTAVSQLDYASTRASYLTSVEGAFSNASAEGGLDDLINTMFEAMSTLANSPTDGALRRNAMQSATLLTSTVRGINNDLETVQSRVDEQVTAELTTVNDLLRRIYDLNTEISTQHAANVGSANTNDLEDTRDAQVQELAKRIGIKVTLNGPGTMRILTENGRKLLDESSYVQLKRAPGAGVFSDIVAQNVKVDGSLDANEVPISTDSMTRGRIKALVDVRDTTVPALLAELNEFTSTLITEMNLIHSRGGPIPPIATYTSGNTGDLASVNTDLYANLSATLAGDTFHASVVNSQGEVIATTVGNGGAIALPGVGPFSLDDLAHLINGNADIGNAALNTTSTAPAVLGVTEIDSDGTLTAGTYTIRRIDATTVELWNAANSAQIAGTNTVNIVQPSVGSQTLNFGQGLVVTTDATLDISGTADGAAAGTITLGNTQGITATATVDGSGNPVIQLQTQTTGQYIVLSNASGDMLGLLGMNNLFTGTNSDDIAVHSSIAANPDLLAVARMRTADGGVSSLNNENVLALAQMADTDTAFSAAGALGAQTTTLVGYVGQMVSDLAITINDANSRETFTEALNNQINELKGGLSGVNVNEELSQMLIYQNGFQTSARIISVVSDLFDTLLGIIR